MPEAFRITRFSHPGHNASASAQHSIRKVLKYRITHHEQLEHLPKITQPSRFLSGRALGLAAYMLILGLVCLAPARPAHADGKPLSAPIERIKGVSITVGNLDREVSFFTDVLMFERAGAETRSGHDFETLQGLPGAKARVAHLRLGDESIELVEYETPKGRPFPPDSHSNDRWFQHIAIIVSDMERAHACLDERMVRHASREPQRLPDWNRNAAGIKAFYFRDPEGHFLELLEFPPDKGNPKWHRKTDALFLGIDHTAIVVADTDASLRFYCDTCGLKVVGGSENYGMEQADLNNVPNAHLRITTLRAGAGPAIELLEYLEPRDGRPYPADSQANDLWNWQTIVAIHDAHVLQQQLQGYGAKFASLVQASDDPPSPGKTSVFLVRDPDRHAIVASMPVVINDPDYR